ncbi:LamB/YcsF family protein [Candidatus Thioglobus sp.]|uniref:LamB/YcsF family protein n=1 Tax=Candidatus Thioglobus sp. TaxID=2026721 RepID=UPI003D0A63B1
MQQSISNKLINCDLGECLSPNPDSQIMPLIGMASIACAGHVGDDKSMVKAIQLAQQNKVKIGVHPSYADQANFGRKSQALSKSQLYELIHGQVAHFQQLCHQQGTVLEYIKPHGTLYHDMMSRTDVFEVLCEVIKAINPSLALVVQAGKEAHLEKFEKNQKLTFLREVFADRGYNGLQMIPRGEKNAVLDNSKAIVDQFWHFYNNKTLNINTICFHSDNKASVEALKCLKNA